MSRTRQIGIIDYGMGNLGSIRNSLDRIHVTSKMVQHPEDFADVCGVILPGVGQFAAGMSNLAARNLREPLEEKVRRGGLPLLGICLGFQLLTQSSEEGDCAGLGWIAAKTTRFSFPDNRELRVPHVGWNTVSFSPGKLVSGLGSGARFYFTHSYFVEPTGNISWIGETEYGRPFLSMFAHDTLFGTQFHPEKSHGSGLQVLKNFVEAIP